MSFVVDTTVLSNFAAIGQLDILRQIFGVLYLPLEVYSEIEDGLDGGYQFYEPIERMVHPFVDGGWLHLALVSDEEELRFLRALPSGLHRGEAAAISIAVNRSWVLLTDDRAARSEAARWGVQCSGTIGCLVAAVERGLSSIDEANAWLRDMIAHGYHSPLPDITALLKREDLA